MTSLTVFQCDRADCTEQSEPRECPPPGWIEMCCFGTDPDKDVYFQYCGFECALHGVGQTLDTHDRMGDP